MPAPLLVPGNDVRKRVDAAGGSSTLPRSHAPTQYAIAPRRQAAQQQKEAERSAVAHDMLRPGRLANRPYSAPAQHAKEELPFRWRRSRSPLGKHALAQRRRHFARRERQDIAQTLGLSKESSAASTRPAQPWDLNSLLQPDKDTSGAHEPTPEQMVRLTCIVVDRMQNSGESGIVQACPSRADTGL